MTGVGYPAVCHSLDDDALGALAERALIEFQHDSKR